MKTIEDCAIFFMPVVNESGSEQSLEAKVCMFARNEAGSVAEGWGSDEISTGGDRTDVREEALRCYLDGLADFWRGRVWNDEAVLAQFREMAPVLLASVNQRFQDALSEEALALGTQLFQTAALDAISVQ